MDILIGVSLLATLIEGIVTYLFHGDDSQTKPWARYIALALGVAFALAYQIDILALFGILSPYPLVGSVISGLIIGRGSNYVNDIVGKIRR